MLSRFCRRTLPVFHQQTRAVTLKSTHDIFEFELELDDSAKTIKSLQYLMWGAGPNNVSDLGQGWMVGKTLDQVQAEIVENRKEPRIPADLHAWDVIDKCIAEYKAGTVKME